MASENSKIKEVTAYQLTDGRIVTDLEKAVDLQNEIDLIADLKEVIEEVTGYSSIEIIKMIVENKKVIAAVLNKHKCS